MNKQSSGFNFNVPSIQEGFDFQKPYVPLVLSENERKEVEEMEKIIKLWCKSCENERKEVEEMEKIIKLWYKSCEKD